MEEAGVILDLCGEIAKGHVFVNKALNKIVKLSSLGEVFPVERSMRMAKLFADQVQDHLTQNRSDIVFSPGSIPMALLRTDRPKVFYADATFAGILAHYPEFSDYPKRYIKDGHVLEQKALDNCDLAIYSSQWAARSAVDYYGMDESRIRVVPFGSNLHEEPSRHFVEERIRSRDRQVCELLFIGVAWERKGGPKVLEIARHLRAQGVEARVHLVGTELPNDDLPSYIVQHGFISKETPEGRKKFADILSRTHFLVLPSIAECMGIVLCEANAFGVPCLANDVGGIPEVLKDGRNGHLFHIDTPAQEWVERIAGIFSDRKGYEDLALRSRVEYEQRLNWTTTGTAIRQYLEELL